MSIENIDYNEFDEKTVNEVIANGDDLFEEKIYDGSTLICKIDKEDRKVYEAVNLVSVHDAAVQLIKKNSPDGTIAAGIKVLEQKSKLHDAAAYVGYLLSSTL